MTAFHIRPYEHYCTEEILPLYEAVGWTNYTQRPDMLRDAFAGSRDVLAAYDGTQLVGILRAVGDGASHSVCAGYPGAAPLAAPRRRLRTDAGAAGPLAADIPDDALHRRHPQDRELL